MEEFLNLKSSIVAFIAAGSMTGLECDSAVEMRSGWYTNETGPPSSEKCKTFLFGFEKKTVFLSLACPIW